MESRMKTRDIVLGVLAVLAILFIIWQSDEDAPARQPEVTLYVSQKQSCAAPVLSAFERKTGVKVRAVYFDTKASGEAVMVKRLMTDGAALPDLFWVTSSFTAELLKQKGVARAYRSPAAAAIMPGFKDAAGYWTGIGARARTLIVNKRVAEAPQSLQDYTDPAYRNRTAIGRLSAGNTALQIAALFVRWGDERADAFVRAMNANGVTYTPGDTVSADFVSNGTFDFALVDSDVALRRERAGAPVSILYPDQGADGMGTMVIPDAIGLVRGAAHPAAAKRLIDALLSPETARELAASECALMPLVPGVETPKDVKTVAQLRVMPVDVAAVLQKRRALGTYLQKWGAQ